MTGRIGSKRSAVLIALRPPQTSPGSAAGAEVESAADPDPDQAWRVLDQTMRMVSHAEGKAALTLASAGVMSGLLFSAVQTAHAIDPAAAAAAAACGLLTLAASMCAAVSLWSRTSPRDLSRLANLLYFQHIARDYRDRLAADRYTSILINLTREPERLAVDIAGQVWANAHVAARKYRWVNRSIGALLGGLVLLGAAGALLAF